MDTAPKSKCPYRALIRAGKLPEFQRVAELGLNIRKLGGELLRTATTWGHLNFVQYIIGIGVDVYPIISELMCSAAANGHIEIIQYLVTIGADIRADRHLCLYSSVTFGAPRSVRYLVSIGADVRAGGNRCVRASAGYGDLELVRYLVAVGGSNAQIIAQNSKCIREYLMLRGMFTGSLARRTKEVLLTGARARARAARRVYLRSSCWWIPRYFDLARRSGRRARARNFREFRRLSSCAN